MRPPADLSVVVVALDGGRQLETCLGALRAQHSPPAMEVVVAHDAGLAELDNLRKRFPEARLVAVQAGENFPALRAVGVRHSTGKVVAVTEDQCIPPPEWCASIIAAHGALRHPAIGGPVEKFEPDTLTGWAIYLREFTDYIPPVPEGPSERLTDCNVSYKREALEAISKVWREEFHEPVVHSALAARGETLWLSPALNSGMRRPVPFLRACAERARFGRLYAGLRCAQLTAGKRLLLILVSPLLPAVFLFRVARAVFRKRRYIARFFLALPLLALFSTLWSMGEFLGYISPRQPNHASRVSGFGSDADRITEVQESKTRHESR